MFIEYLTCLLSFLIKNINIGTFLIAVLTFIITFVNFYNNRASLELSQPTESKSVLIKPDFVDLKTPDRYWHNEYRLIIDVILTNKSSKPISVIEFVLNDKLIFNSYHVPGPEYHITIQPRKTKVNGMIGLGTSKTAIYPIGNLWLNPIIDIPPQTSVRGHLFFHFSNKELVQNKRNKLKIITSRKTFAKYLDVSETQMSCLSPPTEIQRARDQSF